MLEGVDRGRGGDQAEIASIICKLEEDQNTNMSEAETLMIVATAPKATLVCEEKKDGQKEGRKGELGFPLSCLSPSSELLLTFKTDISDSRAKISIRGGVW
jgi:hypothetical protein